MARTKASVGAKISSGKSSKARCSVAPTTSTGISSGSSDKSSRGSGGGNPVCPRETPKWQRPITSFFINKHEDSLETDENCDAAGSSKPKSKKHNIIQSSDDDTTPEKPTNKEKVINNEPPNNEQPNKDKPRNQELDETIELEPLSGENNHKIQEYYPKGARGKGKGKKTKGTKHVDSKGEDDGKKEKVSEGDGESSDLNENSNDSKSEKTDKENIPVKGKGIGKKTKVTKHVDTNGVSEEEGVLDGDGKIENKLSSNDRSDSESIDKENVDNNIEKESDIVADKDSIIVSRKKREREDRIEEEGNISKKIKVN